MIVRKKIRQLFEEDELYTVRELSTLVGKPVNQIRAYISQIKNPAVDNPYHLDLIKYQDDEGSTLWGTRHAVRKRIMYEYATE